MAKGGRPRQKSEYGLQLAEKQKIREEYGLREKQFRRYFDKGQKPENIFSLLEFRLDSIVFAGGFTPTRRMARQLISHGHMQVNGKKVTIASYQVRPGDIITVKETSAVKGIFADYEIRVKNLNPPSWLVLDKKKKELKVKSLPDIKEQIQPFNFQTVIEFYSR
ncbi:MAG: 30S ribosomal protein S4 [Candidatus Spechtbacterales bacterium]